MNKQEKFDKLTAGYAVSAREYFDILRLALSHKGIRTDCSVLTMEAINKLESDEEREDIYDLAIRILLTLYTKGV